MAKAGEDMVGGYWSIEIIVIPNLFRDPNIKVDITSVT